MEQPLHLTVAVSSLLAVKLTASHTEHRTDVAPDGYSRIVRQLPHTKWETPTRATAVGVTVEHRMQRTDCAGVA